MMYVKTGNGNTRKIEGRAENSMLRANANTDDMVAFLTKLESLRNKSNATKQLIRDIKFWLKVKAPATIAPAPIAPVVQTVTHKLVTMGVVSKIQDTHS